ncbi:hypothetical protein [Sphingomonas bacterium]|uniref:hypothetical protein n=1 Tax=Sphingomonas bacterium TaxID=1895847 RepID=UPI00157692C0|nr:hypothetical protein [Sphingomonas bacterium]
MVTMIHQAAPPMTGYVVPSPRATDAIGAALRDAYGSRGGLPEEMIAALRALDRHGRG